MRVLLDENVDRREKDGTNDATSGFAETIRNQMETNRRLVEAMAKQFQKQREVSQALIEASIKAYMDLLYAPILCTPNSSYSRDGHGSGDKDTGLPIEDYDQLSIKEISSRLKELGAIEIAELRAYEKRNKNRRTLLELFDRSLV